MAERLQPEVRRDLILDAAAAEFLAEGFRGASMRSIARRAGMSVMGVIHHFPDIDAVLLALLERRQRRDVAELTKLAQARAGLGRRPGIRENFVVAAEYYAARPEETRLYGILEGEAVEPTHPAHAHFAARNKEEEEGLARVLRDEFVNADEITTFVQVASSGAHRRTQWDPERFPLAQEWALVADLAERLGIRRDAAEASDADGAASDASRG